MAFITLNFLVINVRSISDQSIADAGSANITILLLFEYMECQEAVFGIVDGDREEGKK